MSGVKRSYGFLIEMLLVLLFFSLSAVVLLRVFLASGQKSDRTTLRNAALISAQSLMEQSLTDAQPRTEIFTEGGDSYQVSIAVSPKEEGAGGTLYQLTASATDEAGVELLSVPLETSLFWEDGGTAT